MWRLQHHLAHWRQAGLIDAETAAAITDWENERGRHGLGRLLAGLGAAVIGIGVISLIAANWQAIPDGVKLGGDLLLMALVALGILRLPDDGFWRDAAILFFQLLGLASIGLISQVYHLDGALWSALGYWSVMMLPTTLYARGRWSAELWSGLFLLAVGLWLYEPAVGRMLGMAPQARYGEDLLFVGYLLFLLALMLAGLPGERLAALRRAFAGNAVALGAVLTVWLDALSGLSVSDGIEARFFMIVTILNAVVLLLGWWRLPWRRSARVLTVFLLLLLWLKVVVPDEGPGEMESIRGALFSLAMLSGAMVLSVIQGWHRAFRWLTLAAGVRFFLLYLQAFGGLAATGVGLILSGLLILALVWLWRRGDGLFQRMRRGLQ